MEGTKTGPKRMLSIDRQFTNGRLERQLWNRAYELALPLVRASRSERTNDEFESNVGLDVRNELVSQNSEGA
jgi:hypothetical protein